MKVTFDETQFIKLQTEVESTYSDRADSLTGLIQPVALRVLSLPPSREDPGNEVGFNCVSSLSG